MSGIGQDDERDEVYEHDVAALRQRGLPVPQDGVPQISPERLDLDALWDALSDDERVSIGRIGLGLAVAGVISNGAEGLAPAASRAADALYRVCVEDLADAPVSERILDALRGPSWRIPNWLGPVCRSCGCSESDACAGGCAWADATRTRCTACTDEAQTECAACARRKAPGYDLDEGIPF